MYERIKILRKSLKLSQSSFGEKIGVSRDVIKNLELNLVDVKEHFIKLICNEFNVNEDWLRTGEGEMFKEVPEEDEVAAYVAELLEDDGENPLFTLIKEIMHTYDQLDNKSKDVMKDYFSRLLNNLNAKKEG